jgi:hypothetical protein
LQAVLTGWKVAGGPTRSSAAPAARSPVAARSGGNVGSHGNKSKAAAKTAPQAGPAHATNHAAHHATPAVGAAAASNTATHAAPAATAHEAGAARVEPALRPKTVRPSADSTARSGASSATAAGSDADWETF